MSVLKVRWETDGYGKVMLGAMPVFDVALSYASNPALAQAQRDMVETMLKSINETKKLPSLHVQDVRADQYPVKRSVKAHQELHRKTQDQDMGKLLQWR